VSVLRGRLLRVVAVQSLGAAEESSVISVVAILANLPIHEQVQEFVVLSVDDDLPARAIFLSDWVNIAPVVFRPVAASVLRLHVVG
jgi:hypothetical protein